MVKNRHISALFLSLLFVQSALIPIYSTQAAKVETRWYQVEIILFKQNNSSTTVQEPLPENTILPDPSGAIPLNHTGDPTKTWDGSVAFKLLDQSQLLMRNYYAKLAANPAYKPVAHIAWRMPIPRNRNGYKMQLNLGPLVTKATKSTAPESNTPNTPNNSTVPPDNDSPVINDSGNSTTPAQPGTPTSPARNQVHEFTGTLNISRPFYIHFDIDLAYYKAGATPEANKIYRMQQVRRMKSKEVHLLDHPMFGIIVYFAPVQGTEKFY